MSATAGSGVMLSDGTTQVQPGPYRVQLTFFELLVMVGSGEGGGDD
jgi:hypothetical protein